MNNLQGYKKLAQQERHAVYDNMKNVMCFKQICRASGSKRYEISGFLETDSGTPIRLQNSTGI